MASPGSPAWIDVVGVGAALCSMSSFVPQIVKIVKARDASSVSLHMYVVSVTGFGLWIGYGVLADSWPVAASNTVNLALSSVILVLRQRMNRRGRMRT